MLLLTFILGMATGVITPVLRRHGRTAATLLAIGAAILLAPAVADFVHPDPRIGLAALQSNRNQELLIMGCELPVLALALVSLRGFSKLYWLGWAIHTALSVYWTVIFVWLEFFWHW